MRRELLSRDLRPEEYPAWSELVARSPHGSPYALPDYLTALCRETGGSFRVVAAVRGGKLLGGVALYEESSRFGPVVSTRLLLQYNGLILDEPATRYPSKRTSDEVATLRSLEAELRQRRYAGLSLKSRSTLEDVRVFVDAGWQARPTYTYVVPIADLGAQWLRVEHNLRRLVRRCEKDKLAFTDDDDFDSFYRMHLQTHERKGAPLYLPRQSFERFFRSLHSLGLCRLYHVRLADGRSIASLLVLLGHPVTHTVAAAADPEFLRSGASAFLRWRVFEELSRQGYRGNDLTDASLNPVTHFKAQLGGDLRACLVVSRPEVLAARMARRVAGWRGALTARLRRT